MNDAELDRKLEAGRDAVWAPVMTRELVMEASAAARREVDSQRSHKRLGIVASVIGIGALLSIAGTTLLVNDSDLSNPISIPITYVANDGSTVSCENVLGGAGGAAPEVVAEWEAAVAGIDWTGVGQEAHDRAVADPFVPGPNDDWPDDASQESLDMASWNFAIGAVIRERLPDDVPDGFYSGGSSNCSGKL